MENNYLNILIAAALLFGVGVLISRFGGIFGLMKRLKKALEWLSGYEK